MTVITICQPYSHLIALGLKPIENRNWPTRYRGPIGIHAGKSRAWLDEWSLDDYPDMPFGKLEAVADLVDCVPLIAMPRLYPELASNEHANGPYCWILRDVHRLLRPVACRGSQGLWRLPDSILNGRDLVPVTQVA